MIKLYNYDKETLKFRRVLELEQMPDNYEFCSLVKIPKYNEETEYLEYDRENDGWIIKDIPVPVYDIEFEKSNIKQQIQVECSRTIYAKYPDWKQSNISITGTELQREEFGEYRDYIILQADKFELQVDNLTTEQEIKEYTFKFIEELILTFKELKAKLIKQIKNKTNEIIEKKYDKYTQINIINGLNGYTYKDKTEYDNFSNKIIEQGHLFQNQVNAITTKTKLKEYTFEFEIPE